MTVQRIIGIDPGPVPGLVYLEYAGMPGFLPMRDRCEALQCTPGLLPDILGDLIDLKQSPVLIAVEKFVVSHRSGSSRSPKAGATTRDLVGQVLEVARTCGVPVASRSAVAVKPWATDERLAKAGLLDLTAGMRHARDAARHALFAAVSDCNVPDPLSSRKANQ